MLRRVMVLLAAPAFVAAAQAPASGSVEIPVSGPGVTVSLSSNAYQVITTDSTGKQQLLRGGGALSYYFFAAERELSIAATDSAATIHVELKDQGRTLAFATGRTVNLRMHDGLLTVDARPDGPLALTPRPPGQE